MPEGVLVVLTAPSQASRAAEYDDWYDNVHIPELLDAVPAITGVRRFSLLGEVPADLAGRRRLAIYTLDDVDAARADLAAAAGTLSSSDALQSDPPPLPLFFVAEAEGDDTSRI